MSYKVVQWATGGMGTSCLRAVLDHPDMQLVGLRVYNPQKVGKNAGEIASKDSPGVIATDDIEEILALNADVVVHAARLHPDPTHHLDDICRLLSSGKNVISINGDTYPYHWGEEHVAKIERACAEGNSSLYGTGLNPGFVSERLTAVISGICSDIEHIDISEVLDCSKLPDPTYAFDILGFGSEVGSIDPNDESFAPARMVNGLFKEVVHELVARFGLQLHAVETDHAMLPATEDLEVAAGTIKKGCNAHTRWRWHAIVDGKRFFTMTINWIMETSHLGRDSWNLWDLHIKGTPNIDIAFNMSASRGSEEEAHHSIEAAVGLGVAASVINSIPFVCEAEAGIVLNPMATHYRAPRRSRTEGT